MIGRQRQGENTAPPEIAAPATAAPDIVQQVVADCGIVADNT